MTRGAADRAIRLGIAATLLLMGGKLAAGIIGGSGAVVADGIESGCDLLAILATMVALRIGRTPGDERHPYGHGRAESIAAVVIAVIVVVTGAGVLASAMMTLATGSFLRPEPVAVAAAAATIVIKEALYRYTARVAGELRSHALQAVAMDHRKDALTSVATLAGVTGAYLGYEILDPLAAGLISLFIFRIGWEIFSAAAHDLMDGVPPGEELAAIAAVAEGVPGVERVHGIRGRRSGAMVIIDLKLEMDPAMTVQAAHDVADAVKAGIFDRFPQVGDVMIHINPSDVEHVDLTRL